MATTATPPTKTANKPPVGPARPLRKLVPHAPPIVRFYRSSVGKKWVMAVTGLMLMGFVVAMSGVVVMVAVVRQRLGGPAFLFVKMPLAFRLLAFKMLLAFIGLGGLQGIL